MIIHIPGGPAASFAVTAAVAFTTLAGTRTAATDAPARSRRGPEGAAPS